MSNSIFWKKPQQLEPIFVDLLPATGSIGPGELWISLKHRTLNLRCPCACGKLRVLTIHPSRWHFYFDGKAVSLCSTTGGSVWSHSGCGSHYFIRRNTVIWAERIDPKWHNEYAQIEKARLIDSHAGRVPNKSGFKRALSYLLRRLLASKDY